MKRHPKGKRPHILFLFSDTGGGHRSAAEATIEALERLFGDLLTTEMVDIFKDYAPRPLNILPELYPHMVRMPRAWEVGYRLSDGQRRAQFLINSFWPYVRHAAKNLLTEHPSDLIVSVHPGANAPILQALGENRPPFVTIVTDLVSTHALWYDRRAERCLVPTEPARQRALACGLDPARVQVVGLPVAECACRSDLDRIALRTQLGWPADQPVLLLMGGGEGMGALESLAYQIDQAGLPAALAVVTGRNQALRAKLNRHDWSRPTFVYGFVREIPNFMRAADVLVTKAGPGTISEAFTAGLPIVLYARLPGQEDGNVSYVVSEGAGVWAPQPPQLIAVIETWLQNPQLRMKVAAASRRLAQPGAARTVARILAAQFKLKDPDPKGVKEGSPNLG